MEKFIIKQEGQQVKFAQLHKDGSIFWTYSPYIATEFALKEEAEKRVALLKQLDSHTNFVVKNSICWVGE